MAFCGHERLVDGLRSCTYAIGEKHIVGLQYYIPILYDC